MTHKPDIRVWCILSLLLLATALPARADGEGGIVEEVRASRAMSGRERRLSALEIHAELRREEVQEASEAIDFGVSILQPTTMGTEGLTPTQRINRRFRENDPLRVRWALDLGARRITRIVTPPPHLQHEFALYFSDQHDVIAIHMRTGTPLWWTRTAAPLTGDPFFTRHHVYMTVRDHVMMLETGTGIARWSVRLPFAPSSGPSVVEPRDGTPILYIAGLDRMVYAIEMVREIWPPRGQMMKLTRNDFQMEIFTPFVMWYFRTNGVVKSEPAYTNGRLVFGDWDGYVYGINTRAVEGRIPTDYWRKRTRGAYTVPPLINRGAIIVCADDQTVNSYSTRDGTRFWRTILPEAVNDTPQFVHDPVTLNLFFLCSAGRDKTLYTLNPDTGLPLWQMDGGERVIALMQDNEKPDSEKTLALILRGNNVVSAVPISKPIRVTRPEREALDRAGRFPSPDVVWEHRLRDFTPFAQNARLPYILTATENGRVVCAIELNAHGSQ